MLSHILSVRGIKYDSNTLRMMLKWLKDHGAPTSNVEVFEVKNWEEMGKAIWDFVSRGDAKAQKISAMWRSVLEMLKALQAEKEVAAAAKISIEDTPEKKRSVCGKVVNNSDSDEELNTEGDVTNGGNDQPLSNLPLEQGPIPSAPLCEADTSPGEAIKKRWKDINDKMLTKGLNPVAFPVTVRQNAPNVWQPFNWDLIKEVRKTVMANGLSAPFSQALLENIFSGQILTGFDCTQLATMILTPTQRLLWKVKWAELCDLAALRNLDRPEGDPQYMITTAQMMGTGDFADVNRQARLLVEALQESASLALKAMVTLPEAGKPEQSFTSIRQGNTEPYMSFIDRL
ncbi:endogenous retrovirus group K member 9 Gag polyprotein-like [Harpia harpyja]|uniref:endogenous retrovirus group K member 9 Gag polyprotein-like n=1 Tax=Harpia harpyja TaxID=202280 RepID=UPI0022B10520|nr:endogenous retrovirus group K member 9 Gag polyprotein-like [Harpia harpyja]